MREGVQDATGTPPRSFDSFARDYAPPRFVNDLMNVILSEYRDRRARCPS